MAEELEQPGEPQEPKAEPQPAPNERFKWYILHAYSGFERKVRESIESRMQAFGLTDKVGRVMIPTEPVTEIVNGKKRTVERVFLPGYVLVEMELDNHLWHVLKDTPKVTGFLGTGDKPVALSEEEVSSILFRSETAKDKPRLKIKFEKSEQVRITDGPVCQLQRRGGRNQRRSRDPQGHGDHLRTLHPRRTRVRQSRKD